MNQNMPLNTNELNRRCWGKSSDVPPAERSSDGSAYDGSCGGCERDETTIAATLPMAGPAYFSEEIRLMS